MARTRQDLSTDVLRKLGILSALETASAEDSSLVEARYTDKIEELRDKGIVYWPNTTRTTEEIPSAVFGALVNLMCEDVASHFGAQIPTLTDDNGQQVSCGTKGMRDLRRHMAKGPSGEPTEATFY